MIKNATFVETDCKVNTDTNEVFDIETVDVDGFDLGILDCEYIIDGHGFIPYDDFSGYWYEY